ncbi:MAG: hypothetical protein WCV63_09905 [Negativicutes bacterium]|jgi:hypothetical protein
MTQLKPAKPNATTEKNSKFHQAKNTKTGFMGGAQSKTNVKKTHSPRGK